MPRLLLATLIAVGLVAPPAGLAPEADAQAWKVKRSKNRTKASAKRSSDTPRATRSSRKKTEKRSRRQRVELVPDDDAAPRRERRLSGDEDGDDLAPAVIKVEEVFD